MARFRLGRAVLRWHIIFDGPAARTRTATEHPRLYLADHRVCCTNIYSNVKGDNCVGGISTKYFENIDSKKEVL